MSDETTHAAGSAGAVKSGLAGATFCELVVQASQNASYYRSECDQHDALQRNAARQFSLAITALEEARMRFSRGMSLSLFGEYATPDLEREKGVEAVRSLIESLSR